MKNSSFRSKITLFDLINYFLVTSFALLCLIPFAYVIGWSFMTYPEYLSNPMAMIPKNIDFTAYRKVLATPLMFSGYRMTFFITIVGTGLNLFLLIISSYPLSKKNLKGRNVILMFILFTMFFNGGMIPNYYLVRSLHLLNTPFALILPGAISAYNLILMKNFVSTIPDSLEESAIIDGANHLQVLFKIIVPLSGPAIATFCLFHAVAHWNSFFSAILYTTKRSLWPLALVVREVVIEGLTATSDLQDPDVLNRVQPFTIKMATIIIAVLPILVTYPFLQKYFTKGLMMGAIKG